MTIQLNNKSQRTVYNKQNRNKCFYIIAENTENTFIIIECNSINNRRKCTFLGFVNGRCKCELPLYNSKH